MLPRQHDILIVAALIRRGDDLLLVQEQGPDNPAPFWALPGGRVEAGELLPDALAREVREETGLEVLTPGRLLYLTQHYTPTAYTWSGMPHDTPSLSTAFIFEVESWRGDLCPDDPDAFIITCAFLPLAQAISHLEAAPWPVMTEPLLALLRGEVAPGAAWFYRSQPDGSDPLIARLG